MNKVQSPLFLVFAKRRSSKDEYAHLYLRILFRGDIHEKSLGIKCLYSSWNYQTITIEHDPVNTYKLMQEFELLRQKLMGAYHLLMQEDAEFTLSEILDVYSDNRKPGAMSFFQCFNDLINRMERSRGDDGASETNIQKHKRALAHFQGFCKLHYKASDIAFQKINRNAVDEFVDYLKAEGECSHNTAMKYMQIFKKVYRIGMDNGWVKVNAFSNFKFRMKTVERGFLSDSELKKLQEKELSLPRLAIVRDLFVFSCFTGLAYIDVKNLKRKNILDSSKSYWIKSKRTKTGIEASIPLLPPAKKILDKYSPEWEGFGKDELLLNVITNQKMNAYLKEIADLCKIDKTITFHLARHTFATTVTLSNNIPLETVSKMLGHSRISMTQHYSKVVDLKIERDTLQLHKKYR